MTTETQPAFDGARLRQARQDAGFTMEGLARQVDVSVNNVVNWERRGICPNGSSLVRLAAVLERSVESFFSTDGGRA